MFISEAIASQGSVAMQNSSMSGFFIQMILVFAIFSINTQSLMSEEAILIICIPKFTHISTDFSSNGVDIVIQPDFFIVSINMW